MPGQVTLPNLGLTAYWNLGSDDWKPGMDINLSTLDTVLFLAVASATTTAPPGSPTDGDRYIVPTSASGAWSGHVGAVARWRNSAWEFLTPKLGWLAWVVDAGSYFQYSGSVWASAGFVTATYVNTAITNLVNSAPSAMDTLGEIATLLASDESTAAALTTTVGGKVSKTGDTMTGGLHLTVPGSSDNSDLATSTSWVRTYVTGLGFGTGSGTVTSVNLSLPALFSLSGNPITTSGTLTVTLANQAANKVLAGPASGSPDVPTFRSIVQADLPVAPYAFSGFYPGVPANSAILLVHKCSMPVTFPANFGTTTSGAASGAGCTINATASTVISIDQCVAANDPTVGGNWTQIGTLTISAGGHAAALATVSGTLKTAASGDFIRAVGPSTADATAANIFLTLAADR